jgi:leader peptidase (prepilin peptidase)/N-methyltransferase
MLELQPIHLFLAAIAGACFGSFITLASYRLPRDEDIIKKPSRCPHCDARLKAIDLFPVLSWWIRRGKCGYCGVRISWRYPLIEAITAALFVLNVALYGFTLLAALFCLFAVILMILIVTDFEHYIIPDEIQAALVALATLYNFMGKITFMESLYGLLLGLLTGFILHYGYRWLRHKDGLGLGDVKLLAVSGLWIGRLSLVPLFFYAGILGIFTALPWRLAGRGARFPFGPSIAASLYILVIWPESGAYFWQFMRSIMGVPAP